MCIVKILTTVHTGFVMDLLDDPEALGQTSSDAGIKALHGNQTSEHLQKNVWVPYDCIDIILTCWIEKEL